MGPVFQLVTKVTSRFPLEGGRPTLLSGSLKNLTQEVFVLKQHNLKNTLAALWGRLYLVPLCLVMVFLTATAATEEASALYIVTGAEDTAIVLTGEGEAPDLSSQMIDITSGSKGYDVVLAAKQVVTIHHDGETTEVQARRRDTITKVLQRAEIVPSPLETVAIDVSGDTVELTIGEEITYYDRVVEQVTCDTIRRPNANMKKGEEKVIQEGSDGVRSSIYEVVFSNGKELSRQFVEELDSTAVDRIVEYGTAVETAAAPTANVQSAISSVTKNADGSGTLILADGSRLEFSAAKSMTATAYTAGYDGADYTTATGTFVRVGTVAVDKRVIPLGTRMYIVTNDGIVYGLSVAEDTGVRGDKVDLYFETYQQCINFGRRGCTVYILK